MSESIGTTLGSPYRELAKEEEPLTDAEIVFWGQIYAGYVAKYGDSPHGATRIADESIQIRRKKFGVR